MNLKLLLPSGCGKFEFSRLDERINPDCFIGKFILPIQILSLNELLNLHFHPRSDYKNEIQALLSLLASKQKPKHPLEKAQIQIHRFAPRMFDFDGLVGAMKPFVDGIRRIGIILDDNWSVTGPWIVDQTRVKKEESRIEITISGLIPANPMKRSKCTESPSS